MSSRRPRFDDGDAGRVSDSDATPPRGQRGPGDDTADWEWDDDWREPNYLVRRAVTVGAVVVAIALVAIVASRFIGGDSESSSNTESAEWNTVVVITDEGATVLNADGTEVDTIAGESLDNTSLVIGKVLVSLRDDGRITQTDLGDGSVERDRAEPDATVRLSPDNPTIAIVDKPTGGDVSVIDAINREVISIADVAALDDPLIFATDVRVNPAGTHVAAPVPNLFQSFVIDLDTKTSTALAGRVIAINDEMVVTEQPAGDRSELEFYDLLGERLGSVDVVAPAASMLRSDGTMLLVAADGDISSASADATDNIGQVVDPDGRRVEITGGRSAQGGERFIVTGAGTVYVLDASGAQVGSADGRLAIPPTVRSECMVVTNSGGLLVVNTDSAETQGQVERGLAVATSVDGCTVAVGGGTEPILIADGEVIEVDADSVVEVAPDGTAYVVLERRDTDLVSLDGEDRTEIADDPALILFGRR